MISVWMRNYILFKQTWVRQMLAITFEPILALIVLGYGLGAFIPDINGLSFIEFLFPSMMVITSSLVSMYTTSYDAYQKLLPNQLYSLLQSTALTEKSILEGEALWATCLGFFSGMILLTLGATLGLASSFWIVVFPIIIFLISFFSSVVGSYILFKADSFHHLSRYTTATALVLTLLCGTFFPIEIYPTLLKIIILIIPTTHAVLLIRNGLLNTLDWVHLFSFFYLLFICVFAWLLLGRLHLKTK